MTDEEIMVELQCCTASPEERLASRDEAAWLKGATDFGDGKLTLDPVRAAWDDLRRWAPTFPPPHRFTLPITAAQILWLADG